MRGLVSLLLAGSLAGSLAMLAGCGSSAPAPHAAAPSSTVAAGSPTASASPGPSAGAAAVEYVALGDSYSAAPGVPVTDLAGGCLRSSHDYPHLLAAAVPALRLTDVTCSGATTADLTRPQRINQVTVPAQLDALSRRTRLVTLGIGGNDLGLFGTLLGWCLEGGQNCVRGVSAHVDRDTAVIHRRLVSSLRAIHRRAPHATVVLVGYPQLVPANHLGCAGLQVAPAVLAYVGRLIARFSTMMASAARAGGATYVDLVGPSAGHDICSADPWVNGRQPTDRAIPFHPFRAEQQAVAGLLTPLVRQHVG